MKQRKKTRFDTAREIFRQHEGVLKTGEALRLGIHPEVLYAMRDAGVIERLSRGLYRLVDLPQLGNPDLVAVALRVPNGVLCLVSALAHHEITTQIPHEVYLALDRGAEPPRIEHPPVRLFWFTGKAFSEGIETHKIDNVPVRIYCPEKTIADCFKYRNKLGLAIALEALKLYRERKGFDVNKLMHFAEVCRVKNVMRPYVEALV